MTAAGGILLMLAIAAALARVLHPWWRLRWLRRELAVIESLRFAEQELQAREVDETTDAIAKALEAGTLTESEAFARMGRQHAEDDLQRRQMHPVYVRRAQLENEFWARAPLGEIAEACRTLEARLANPALSPFDRKIMHYELDKLRDVQARRSADDAWFPGGTIGAVVFFLGAIGLFLWRRFG
jgi:hypothetical protein